MLFAVIGHPIEHSLSPLLHKISFELMKVEAEYVKVDVPPHRLGDFMSSVDMIFNGINVTIPHKVEVLKYVDVADDLVNEVGAANTLKIKDGKIYAFNTDVEGVRGSIKDAVDPKGLKVAVLGAGGAARAAVVALRDEAQVTVFNRTLEKAKRLAEELGVDYAGLNEVDKIKKHDIIINATPVGMDGVSMPIPPDVIESRHVLMDMVYRPLYTPFLKVGLAKGAKTVNGLKMLVIQGMESEKVWLGASPYWRDVYERLLASLA